MEQKIARLDWSSVDLELSIRKNFETTRIVKHQNRLPRDVLESL